MFTKASLVLIAALLLAILMTQRSQGVVQAQAQTQVEYKVVDTGILVTPDGKPAGPNPLGLSERVPASGAKYLTAQDALDEFGKAGWQLVTHSYVPDKANGGSSGRQLLIFMRK